MKKITALIAAMCILLTACSTNTTSSSQDGSTTPSTSKDTKTFEGKANGYGGDLVLSVTLNGEKIEDITLVSGNESSPVWNRAFPVIKERIISTQSPVVDNVSGATISSFAVKSAVAEACLQGGVDFGKINVNTAPERGEPKQLEDAKTQLVIVGGGSAGLSAAISASENGIKDIILIEKMDILSGNGKFDMNFFDLYNSEAQKAAGNLMTKEEFIESKKTSTDSPERISAWADEAYNLDAWLRGMGIQLNNNYGGTNHMAEVDAYSGEHIQDKLEAKVAELNIDVRTGTKGTDIIMENDKATGVKVETRDGYYNIMADAVIIATGGFSHNKEMLAKYAPGSETVATSNQMSATGDFVPVFEANNFKMENMDVLSVFKLIIKGRRDLTGAGDGFILVNKDGNRFTDETKSGLPLAHTILEQPDGKVFYIYDQNLFDSAYRLKKHNKLGYHVMADTIEELATKLGVDAKNLQASVDSFNKGVAGTEADPFREKSFTREITSEGPFYGVQVESAIHMTKGGVVANENAQVLTSDNAVVNGLYAAGEVTSTTGAYSSSVVFGKIAGQEAAKALAK